MAQTASLESPGVITLNDRRAFGKMNNIRWIFIEYGDLVENFHAVESTASAERERLKIFFFFNLADFGQRNQEKFQIYRIS